MTSHKSLQTSKKQSTNEPTNQPTNQQTNQPTNQPDKPDKPNKPNQTNPNQPKPTITNPNQLTKATNKAKQLFRLPLYDATLDRCRGNLKQGSLGVKTRRLSLYNPPKKTKDWLYKASWPSICDQEKLRTKMPMFLLRKLMYIHSWTNSHHGSFTLPNIQSILPVIDLLKEANVTN